MVSRSRGKSNDFNIILVAQRVRFTVWEGAKVVVVVFPNGERYFKWLIRHTYYREADVGGGGVVVINAELST